MYRYLTALAFLTAISLPCKPVPQQAPEPYKDTRDIHSYGRPEEVRVRHVHLDLDVSFEKKTLSGTATLTVERAGNAAGKALVLDTRDLKINSAAASPDGTNFTAVRWDLGAANKFLGTPLTIHLPETARYVRIGYETIPAASGLQWLTPAQTAGKKQPFLYSQSQAIHARSWMPVQDSPGVRVTYGATIRTPKSVRAVMSARNDGNSALDGEFKFDMPQAIPAYLIALAVGDLGYARLGPRTGVYAEPPLLQKAAAELADTEKMVQAAERLYGPYRWEQYDVLILPPSFPFGGMENPRLTFATPTILAGDKSLVGLIAHELAHSWSGNLVTNATWRDFWLNEGFTTYFERRIQEAVYGRARSEMEALLERRNVEEEMKELPKPDTVLYIDLKGRDPDDGMTQVPYVKGMLLLRRLEELYGRERWDNFLREYFNHFAFRSITTGDFVTYLREHLLHQDSSLAAKVNLDDWLREPGLPSSAPLPLSDALDKVGKQAKDWVSGQAQLTAVPFSSWTTQERLHFLTSLPVQLNADRMAELDRAWNLTQSGNAEVLYQWLLMSIRARYQPAYDALDRFLIEVGRRKYIKPLYAELAKTPEGRERAEAIYRKARPGYHPIAASTIDDLFRTPGK